MADPPSYDESISQPIDKYHELDGEMKTAQRFSIREEVALSRSQHVAALVSRLLPPIRERAKSGISKTSMLLIPSDQAETSSRGQLVGFPEDDRPILIQLEGRYDSTQFWSQQEALDLLRDQTLVAVAGDVPTPLPMVEPLPERPAQPKRSSFWGRKSSQPTGPSKPAPKQSKPPVSVEVQSEQANFRTETEYGLYETVCGRTVLLVVDVR
ncbi:hypothetical protein CLAFUW4_09459 [Fulvia fulva]|uniref:Uncharacterized protein n=1 Tax=Passalora fulva TaxID=5499 RepID=A0A9Q8PFU0_PASFU|nr:uncharacterized protein CLAFUR5_09556 [Fulvia fulva]KAK4613586.1 hypothetical protein CLAFUR4_09465 [Fulvia fulva]UJO21824.1 hypothetical protein CLAFUR5_09556 [Fulvia fulva]WPV20060.1 hypothetical protein CLAFUW4_09459 [Fulvia fulva]WPV35663.1 hypothetical protein CLAFUW7_09460 [Fulvia fulva]